MNSFTIKDYQSIMKLLIDYGKNVDIEVLNGQTPLYKAIESGKLKIGVTFENQKFD